LSLIRGIRDTYREAFSGLPGSVWLIAAVGFVNRTGTMVLPFLALYLADEKGFTVAQAGGVLSLYGVGAVAGAWSGGWLTDHIGARKVMAWSLVLTGAGFLLLGSLDSHVAIALAVLALSIVAESFRPATASALTETSPPGSRARALALGRLAVNLGMTFGPAIGGFLAVRDYRWLFMVDGGTCFLAAALLIWSFRRRRAVAAAATDISSSEIIRSPWRDAPFLMVALSVTLFAIVVFQLFGTYPLYLHSIGGLSEAGIGILFSINTLGIVAFQMPLLHSFRAHAPLKVAGRGAFIFCLGLALMPLGSGYAFFIFTVLVWTAGELFSLPFIEGFIAERADERSRGRYMGMFTLSFSLAFIVAPLIGTWVYSNVGPEFVWYGCGLVGLALWAGMSVVARRVGEAPSRAEMVSETPLP
jgi:predicted MFS family arabinose efflux permease